MDRLGLNFDAINLNFLQIVGTIVVYNLNILFVSRDSPVYRTPGRHDSLVHRTPGSLDSPVHRTILDFSADQLLGLPSAKDTGESFLSPSIAENAGSVSEIHI